MILLLWNSIVLYRAIFKSPPIDGSYKMALHRPSIYSRSAYTMSASMVVDGSLFILSLDSSSSADDSIIME